MTSQERIAIGEKWMALAEMFSGRDLSPDALGMMLNAIDDLPFARIEKFMHDWAKASKLTRHPLPAEIRESINPTPNHQSLAMEATGRVIQAIGKFGLYEPVEAKEWIGDLGWLGVKRVGGWAYLCHALGASLNHGTFTAQMRDLIKAQLDLGEVGIVDEPIMITSGYRRSLTGLTPAKNINFLPTARKE